MPEPQSDPNLPGTGRPAHRLRWLLGLLLFGAAVLNYIDRQTLSILAPTVQHHLGISDAGYSNILTSFLVAYAASLLLSGFIVDRVGAFVGMAIFVTWWSLSNVAIFFAGGFRSLGACRFALGLGEAGNWPASTKVVADVFPARERAAAIGFYTMGASIGATIAPVLIVSLSDRYGWRAAFVATGGLGLVWTSLWIASYRLVRAARTGGASTAQMAMSVDDPEVDGTKPSLTKTLANADVWVLMFARLLTDPVWYFFQFWFAKYLFTVKGVSQSGLSVTWMIYLAADIGSLVGGIASGLLIKKGLKVVTARLGVMLLCAAVMPLSLILSGRASVAVCLFVGSIVVFSHLAWLANISALVVDVIPLQLVATCTGIVGAGSAVGGILMNRVIVKLIEHQSYSQWFALAAFLHPAAWLVLKFGLGRVKRPVALAADKAVPGRAAVVV